MKDKSSFRLPALVKFRQGKFLIVINFKIYKEIIKFVFDG